MVRYLYVAVFLITFSCLKRNISSLPAPTYRSATEVECRLPARTAYASRDNRFPGLLFGHQMDVKYLQAH